MQISQEIKTTGADGMIVLKAGQKAVFSGISSASDIIVEEDESPFWNPIVERKDTGDLYTIDVQNEFCPVLYVTKRVSSTPPTTKGQLAVENDVFKFQLTINGVPAKNIPFWYVNSIRTDGGAPDRMKDKATGSTDENGYFTLKCGDIIALIGVGEIGDKYTVTEVLSEMTENWICTEPTKSGVLELRGSAVTMTNIYKWRSLILRKDFRYQNAGDAQEVTFKFKIEKKLEDGSYEPISGNTWKTEDPFNRMVLEEGNVGPDGILSCNAAMKLVVIEDLEANTIYRVTEVSAMKYGKELLNLLYIPSKASDEWKMPSNAFEITGYYTNEWQMRPLYITKAVTYDEKSIGAAAKANTAVFKMKIEVDVDNDMDGIPDGEMVPLQFFDYYVLQNGVRIRSEKTDINGVFSIQNGQTICFEDAGMIGADFRITEVESGEGFHQVYPTGNQPSTGRLGRNGTESDPVSFVNGMDAAIMITKQYEIADSDAQIYYDSVKDLASGDNPLEITITIRAFTKNGSSYIWPKRDTEVGVMAEDEDLPGRSVVWKAGQSFKLLPAHTVVLKSGLDDDSIIRFNVMESADNRQWLQTWEKSDGNKYLIECTQTYPENGRAATGQNGALKSVKLINTLKSYQPTGSAIKKDMVSGSDPVPTYDRLVFLLEKKVGNDWVPAANIGYYIGHFDHGSTTANWQDLDSTSVSHTNDTGLIEIYKSDYMFPFIQFLTDNVFVYGDSMTPTGEGTLRIRELLEESDSSWGRFAWNSLLENGEQFKPGWQAAEGERTKPYDTIVNTNRTTKVRVGKQSSVKSNQEFTFFLNQVIDIDWSKAPLGISKENYDEAVKETVPAQGIQYSIWAQATSTNESPKMVSGPHILGADGKFNIQAGQYAEFELPDKAIWTVSEEETPGYYLESVVTTEGEIYTVQITDNTTLVSSIAGVVGDRLTVSALQLEWEHGTEIKAEDFEVTLYDSNGNGRKLSSDEYIVEPSYAPEDHSLR